MTTIDVSKIEEAVYKLCVRANTTYSHELYDLVFDKFDKEQDTLKKLKLSNILKNAELAYKKKRPLCQDTGQVIIFVEIGQDVCLQGQNIKTAINNAVEKAYKEKYYRKSVVKNGIFNRKNTETNTPAIIYTDITDGNKLKLQLLIKGAGSENYSSAKNFLPYATKEEIYEFIKKTIETAGEKSCPPYVISIGAGGTFDYASILSKKAFFKKNNTQEENEFIEQLKTYLGQLNENILDTKIMSEATHIASLPIAVTINCHSTRHAECVVTKDEIIYNETTPKYKKTNEIEKQLEEIKTNEIEKLKNLKTGDYILLTGEIYTARDAAHAKLLEDFKNNKKSLINLKDKIIFYAGPCPATPKETIGPIGPTTSSRMDKYTEFMIEQGVIGFIGKGERSKETIDTIKQNQCKYFTLQGGISCLLADCVKNAKIIEYQELETEAIRKLYVEKLPVKTEE